MAPGSLCRPGGATVPPGLRQCAERVPADKPLMEWLQHYTFPREQQHGERAVAEAEYRQLLRRLLSHGTTTALYFGSLHLQACEALVDVAEQVRQGPFSGSWLCTALSMRTRLAGAAGCPPEMCSCS